MIIGGEEIFVLGGSFEVEQDVYSKGSWLRLPHGTEAGKRSSREGCKLFIKTGHLAGGQIAAPGRVQEGKGKSC